MGLGAPTGRWETRGSQEKGSLRGARALPSLSTLISLGTASTSQFKSVRDEA